MNEKGSFLDRNKQRILSKEEQENEEKIRFKLLSKNYHFIPGKEHYDFNLIINAYNKKILSFISRNFFSYIITRRTCVGCGTSRCNFSRLFFIPINLCILKQRKGINNNKISLRDGFDDLQRTCKDIETNKQLICKICNKVSLYQETKSFYRTAKNLIK